MFVREKTYIECVCDWGMEGKSDWVEGFKIRVEGEEGVKNSVYTVVVKVV